MSVTDSGVLCQGTGGSKGAWGHPRRSESAAGTEADGGCIPLVHLSLSPPRVLLPSHCHPRQVGRPTRQLLIASQVSAAWVRHCAPHGRRQLQNACGMQPADDEYPGLPHEQQGLVQHCLQVRGKGTFFGLIQQKRGRAHSHQAVTHVHEGMHIRQTFAGSGSKIAPISTCSVLELMHITSFMR